MNTNITSMELSVIIVNWNSMALLRKCLQSVLSNTTLRASVEIIVIDNASFDGSAGMVSQEFSDVIFIQSQENLGFAGGNNVAVQRSRGDYVLFLNPDAEIVGDALDAMLRVMRTHDDAGVIGPKLVNADLSPQIDCMRAFPTILNEMLDSSLTRRILGRFNFAGVAPVIKEVEGPVGVEMLPGTCIMLRRDVFEQAGRFNEKYFMYAEDVELSYRVKLTGRTNYYVSQAAVIHHGGRSSDQQSESFFSTVMIRESVWQFLRASRGEMYGSLYRLTTFLAAFLRLALLSFVRSLPIGLERRARVARSARKWLKVLRWCLGREGWARRYRPAVRKRQGALVA